MSRPSLRAALEHLAELRDERKRRARDRFKVVARDAADRAEWISQCGPWREIRQTKALFARLMAKPDAQRNAR
jgi:hypothetical protein